MFCGPNPGGVVYIVARYEIECPNPGGVAYCGIIK